MTVFGCLVCFVTGALVVLAAQTALPRTLKEKKCRCRTPQASVPDGETLRQMRNFLNYDGSEQETR